VLLKIANLSRSTYYYQRSKQNVPDKYAHVKALITKVFHENKGVYGYRRITKVLKKMGFGYNHKTVRKLMLLVGLKCMVRLKKYKSYKGPVGKIAPNLLERDFNAEGFKQKWLTDITEMAFMGKKLYFSPILDCYNAEIISYTLSHSPNLELVLKMIQKAFAKFKSLKGLIMHSDQGWHYQHQQYRYLLKEQGIIQSMSRKGNCFDNAKMESFFGVFKSELLYLKHFENIDHLKQEIHAYIRWYNEDRIKLQLNGLSPIKYRQQALLVA